MASMPRLSQEGLEWYETLFGLVPRWTQDPSTAAIENVCRQQLHIPPGDPCTVAFHASGLFNKLYIINSATHPLIIRVSLPVHPRHKTRAEVATLQWVRANTRVPVPKVFGFDDTNDNDIGYEWILMEFMHGTPAQKRWRSMSMEQKIALTKHVATFQAELLGLGRSEPIFRGVGTLDLLEPTLKHKLEVPEKVDLGLLVSHEFFMGNHLRYDIPRGPFRSSYGWLNAVLQIILIHQTAVLDKTQDEDEVEDAEQILDVAQKLLSLLPKVFTPILDESEITGIYHHDLHLNNILVDEEGEITAVLDWECVSALPLWMLATVPKFLGGPVREEEPQRDSYADETPEEAAAAATKQNDPGFLESDGKNELYYIHRMEYEATQLRKAYEARLKELWPEWPLEGSNVKINFFQAISQCDGIWVKKARRWADLLGKGEIVRFEDA
ncbi:hypothetical protein S40288_09392 [Stachybotrys chartarum IBT 40288]|nr:hypothetical protein S40288_09392 [Stachybotrys chartarum IBT 40288]